MSARTATPLPTGTWRVDPVHSSIGFEVGYLAGAFKGHFREFDARLEIEPEHATLAGTAHVASLDVKDEGLAAHLQAPDFLDAEAHPELRFAADELALDGEETRVRGQVTIKGVTHPVEATGAVTAPLTDPHGNERVGLTLTAQVDRTAFGVDWNAELPGGGMALSDEVEIVADLYFVKAG